MSSLVTITSAPGVRAVAQTSAVTRALAVLMDRFGRRSAPAESATCESGTFSRLEAEVLRLSRERAQAAAENQLLNELIGRSARDGAQRLLIRILPDETLGQAVLVDFSDSAFEILARRGTAVSEVTHVEIPDRLCEQLRFESVLQRRFEIHETSAGTVLTLTGTESSRQDQERGIGHLIPVLDEQRLAGVLFTTLLWPPGVPRVDQVQVLSRIGQALLRRRDEERRLDQHRQQLWIATEKLRLKAVTDRATEEPLKTLGDFAAGLCQTTQMDRAVVYLVTRRAGDVPQPVVEAGSHVAPLLRETWRTQEVELARWAMGQSEGQLLRGELLVEHGLQSAGAVAVWPLQSGGRRLGTLILTRRAESTLGDDLQELLNWGSNLLAQTLHRIYRDASIRRQARHDGLTDLANRRTFDALIAVEVERVRLGASDECSLILADLDRFKLINDRFGHQAGDEVLRETAQLLRDHMGRLRTGERSLLARYGGEELAILLPGMGSAGAVRIAEEIRASVEQLSIEFGNRTLQVTISMGVATCPLDGISAADLIAGADAALYQAKSEGRNRVCLHSDFEKSARQSR